MRKGERWWWENGNNEGKEEMVKEGRNNYYAEGKRKWRSEEMTVGRK